MKTIRVIFAIMFISFAISLVIKPKRAEAQVYMNNKCCVPPFGWCYMPFYAPSGAACFCDGWSGRVYGSVCW